MLVSTQTKAVLFLALLCGARAARFEDELNTTQQFRDLLQAHPDGNFGVAFEEELAKADDSISQLSGTCDQASLQSRMVSATSLLQKGQDLNWVSLVKLLRDFSVVAALIQTSRCGMQDLKPGQWDSLKAALQTYAPKGLPHGEIAINDLVADSFSLATFGKLWRDQFGMATVAQGSARDASTTMDEANTAVTSTESDIARFMSDISPHQVDPFNRPLSLLDSGSNTSQLRPKGNWNPIFFVGGIVVGVVALIVAVLCSLINVVSVVAVGLLNVVFGSIYCLIKKAVQMRDPSPEGFLPCMETNAFAQVIAFVWRCSGTCGFWGLKVTQGSYEIAFAAKIKERDRIVGLKATPPGCLKK